MKNLLILFAILIFSGLSFGQTPVRAVGSDESGNSHVVRVDTNGKIVLSSSNNVFGTATTFGAVSIGTSATQLTSTSTPCKKVYITNFTAGETLYIGGSNVTTSNGFPLEYMDTYGIITNDVSNIYLIGSGTIDVRYSYEN